MVLKNPVRIGTVHAAIAAVSHGQDTNRPAECRIFHSILVKIEMQIGKFIVLDGDHAGIPTFQQHPVIYIGEAIVFAKQNAMRVVIPKTITVAVGDPVIPECQLKSACDMISRNNAPVQPLRIGKSKSFNGDIPAKHRCTSIAVYM